MATSAKDSMIMEYKDAIRQLNTTLKAQSELIESAAVVEITEKETTISEHTRKAQSKHDEILKGVPVQAVVIELPG